MKGYLFCQNEKTMTRSLFPYCCGNNREEIPVLRSLRRKYSNLSHIMNRKKNLVRRIFLFFDMFLFCKFAFNISKENGGVPSYLSCYRATSERVRYAFWQIKLAMPCANNREIPFVGVARGVNL